MPLPSLSDARKDALRTLWAAYRADSAPAVMRAYVEALADIPDDVLRAAVDAAIKAEAFFPSVARLRTHADAVRPVVPERPALDAPLVPRAYVSGEVTPLGEDDPRTWYACAHCHDLGWVPGPPHAALGQVYETVERCPCWKTNPSLQRERERRAKYSREKVA